MEQKTPANGTSQDSVPVPPRYKELVEQWGQPIGVEEARTRWGKVVAAAENGTVTLVTAETPESRGRREWAAVVPMSEVADPGRCPVWALTEARPKLGDVIADATRWPGAAPQILTRHRRPVVAVVAAVTLVDLPETGDRIDIDTLLREGGTITLGFDPGHEGAVDPEGEVFQEPMDPCYTAIAKGPDGREIGSGYGDSIADAMLRLWRPPAHLYSNEPPFPDGWGKQPDPWSPDPQF